MSIPSTTTITIYTTVTAATVTSANAVPVFLPGFVASANSAFAGGPLSGTPGVQQVGQQMQAAAAFCALGANCTVQYNPDNTSIIQDSTSGPTLAVAPVFRTLIAASGAGEFWMGGVGQIGLFASGSAGTSRVSLIA